MRIQSPSRLLIALILATPLAHTQIVSAPITTTAAPSGAASGDLSGTYPSPTVAKVNGTLLGTLSPTYGQPLSWLSTAGSTTFIGSGLNDGTYSGTYTGNATVTYCARVTTAAATDKFDWGTNAACSNGATAVSMSGSAQSLSNGASITFAATTGHTLGDKWSITYTSNWLAANLAAATGLPISTGVSGLGTGVAGFLATPSSANLAAALTDETGSGPAVFATSPTFTSAVTMGGSGVSGPTLTLTTGNASFSRIVMGNASQSYTLFTSPGGGQDFSIYDTTASVERFNIAPTTGAISTTSTFSAAGYKISGAATSGNVLRGNGTSFLSAQLNYSDLTGTVVAPTINGMPYGGGTAPTLGSCGAGTQALATGASNNAFTVNLGTSVATSCAVNFGQNFTNAPSCQVSDDNIAIAADVSSVAVGSVTISTSASLATGHLYVHCM